jgi:hypothetical protein
MMIRFIASASMTGALLLAGAPAAAEEGETLILELFGERSWEVSCRLIQSDGDVVEAAETGAAGMSMGRIAVRDVVSGDCRYATDRNAMLRVTLVNGQSLFACPFFYTDDAVCRTYFTGESEGGFEILTAAAASSGS